MVATPDFIKVETEENPSYRLGLSVIYILNRDLTLAEVIISDPLKSLHHELESKGQLDYRFDEKKETEKLKQGVRIMRRENGRIVWRTMPYNPMKDADRR